MFIKNTLVVFPWSPKFKTLSNCPNVKQGNFRIGQLLFRTMFQKSWLIVAKSYSIPLFDTEGIVSNMNRKIAEADTAYLEGMTCPRDYITQIVEITLKSYEDLSLSSCRLHCDTCHNVCKAVSK